MDRKKYIEMCQRISTLECGILGKRKSVPKDLIINVDSVRCYPVAYILSFNDGQCIHTAELRELNSNTTIYIGLNKIKENNND